MGNKTIEQVKKIDFTSPEEQEKLLKQEETIEKARRLAKEKAELEAEEKRKQKEQGEAELTQIFQEINRKRTEGFIQPFKPSRLIDVDSDVAIMNIETMVTSIKENVEFLESKLWDIEGYLCRNDKEKRDSLKREKLKRKASLKGRSQGGTKKQ